jgi:hypothetical protein
MKRRARVRVKLRDRRGRTLAIFTTRPLTASEMRRVYHILLPRLVADLAETLAPRRK